MQAAERSSPELPATSLTIRLLSHLLDCLAPLNAIFQQLNVFVLEQFGHQSMFVKKIFPGTVSGEVSGAWPFHDKMGMVAIKGSCIYFPATLAISFDATFHVGKRIAPLLKNEDPTPRLRGWTSKASNNKKKQCIMFIILLCGEYVSGLGSKWFLIPGCTDCDTVREADRPSVIKSLQIWAE